MRSWVVVSLALFAALLLQDLALARAVSPSREQGIRDLADQLKDSGKVDRDFLYCSIDLELYDDDTGIYCRFARSVIDVAARKANLPSLPPDDIENLRAVVFEMLQRARRDKRPK